MVVVTFVVCSVVLVDVGGVVFFVVLGGAHGGGTRDKLGLS